MSVGRLRNIMRLQAQRAGTPQISTRIGIVTSYDPATYSARVRLQPDNVVTNWMPIESQWIGNGWGLVLPVNVGDMVKVEFLDADVESGTITGRYWNAEDVTPGVQSGEAWLVHQNGQSVKLTNDGKLTLSDGHGATIVLTGAGAIQMSDGDGAHLNLTGLGTISSTGSWTHNGNLVVEGIVNTTSNIIAGGDVSANGKSLDTHVHTGVTGGNSITGPPQ